MRLKNAAFFCRSICALVQAQRQYRGFMQATYDSELYQQLDTMNVKYLAVLTAILLVKGLSSPALQERASQLGLNSIFNDVLVQRSPLTPSQRIQLTSPPPLDGRPSNTVPVGTRAK